AEYLDCQARADIADRDQPLEKALLLAIEEPEQRDLVVADLGVNVQSSLAANRRQRSEAGNGNGDVVAHPGGLDDGLAGLLVNEFAPQVSDHRQYIPGRPEQSARLPSILHSSWQCSARKPRCSSGGVLYLRTASRSAAASRSRSTKRTSVFLSAQFPARPATV